MGKIIRWSGQLALLSGVFWAGTQSAERSGLPIPGSVIGVLLLFFLLLSGLVKLSYVEEVADYLLKHLVFFFVPIAVALMNTADVFLANGWILAIAIFFGIVVPLWVTGRITQMLRRRRGECRL